MKKLLFVCLMMVMGFAASAQFTLGPRVTLTSTNLDIREDIANVKAGDAEFGFQYGLFMRLKVPVIGLYVQPELLFSKTESTITTTANNVDLSFNRVDGKFGNTYNGKSCIF